MRMPWRAREYERTCDDCGYVWRVPVAVARPHMRAPSHVRAGMQLEGALIDETVEANTALSEQAAVSRRCAKCESEHYKQRTIRS